MLSVYQYILFIVCILRTVNCINYTPARKCATLRQEVWQFILEDFDQTVSTARDYRNSFRGWLATGSISVEESCTLHACDKPYLTGNCIKIGDGSRLPGSQQFLVPSIRSASCICNTQCSCFDYTMPAYEYGRTYGAGCDSCQTECYPLLLASEKYRRLSYLAYHIRTGCNLTLYKDEDYQGHSTVFTSGRHWVTLRHFKSYQFTCNESAQMPAMLSSSASYPQQVHIPSSRDGLIEFLESSGTSRGHPGVEAAVASLQESRSWQNVYILLIGSNNTNVTGVFGCNSEVQVDRIWECRVPVNLDHLGISNAELQIIYYNSLNGGISEGRPFLFDYPDNVVSASLAEYLDNHEELKGPIPNVVVVLNKITDTSIDSIRGGLQRRLAVLNALRSRRYPETILEQFKSVISERWEFPKPINIICSKSNLSAVTTGIKGSRKMSNHEYWPRNMQQAILHMTKNAGDEFGFEIFKATSLTNVNLSNVKYVSGDMLHRQSIKVAQFRGYLRNPESVPSRNATTDGDNDLIDAISEFRGTTEDYRAVNVAGDCLPPPANQRLRELVVEISELKITLAEQTKFIMEVTESIKAEIINMIKLDLAKLFE